MWGTAVPVTHSRCGIGRARLPDKQVNYPRSFGLDRQFRTRVLGFIADIMAASNYYPVLGILLDLPFQANGDGRPDMLAGAFA